MNIGGGFETSFLGPTVIIFVLIIINIVHGYSKLDRSVGVPSIHTIFYIRRSRGIET